jgi:hypothetical protein
MGTLEIKSGQTWIVELDDARVQVEVIAAHGEFAETWICRRLDKGGSAGTGPHILLHKRAFVDMAGEAEQANDR